MKQLIRIYASWFAETAQLTDAEKGQLIDALMRSVIMGKEQPPEGNARFIFPQLMARIWRENSTHEKRKAEREARRNDRE